MDRRAWEEFGIPTICLMENAGAGAARVVSARWPAGPRDVVCVCGPGQNGGDGFVVARHLAIGGWRARIVLLQGEGGEGPVGDAGVNLGVCRAMGLPIDAVPGADRIAEAAQTIGRAGIVIDALFGTGLTRPLAGAAATLVDAIASSGRPVVAMDLPSGLDCDLGVPLGPCVRADVTTTFAARKIGFDDPASRRWTGEVVVVPIGAPVDWPPPS